MLTYDWIKNGGQVSVDSMFMFVNGEMVDPESELDPKTPNTVKILVMQVKEGEGFSPIAVDKFYWFADDLFDLTRKKADYHQSYRTELITAMRLFKDKYGIIVGENPPLSVEFIYVTKRDLEANEDCAKSAEKVKSAVKKHFSHAQCEFNFVNAAKLWAQVQARPPRKKPLKWAAQSLSTPEGQIGLVRLVDYYEFLREPNGQLAERFFDSNVRGYWKSTSVNARIAQSLKRGSPPEFWLLNNGITILAEKVETGEHLQVEVTDPQIVNGLQTSREIYIYFSGNAPSVLDDRRLLVRLIRATDASVRDSVIRSTNSQNVMPEEALRATDEIHRQIETLFHRFGLFYDRRMGYYKDQGKAVSQIVSVVDLVQAMLSLVLKRPDEARGRPKDYIKKDEQYASIFGKDKYDLNVYLKAILIVRGVEAFLDSLGLETIHRRNLPYYVSMYAICMLAGNVYAPPRDILRMDVPAALTLAILKDSYDRVLKHYERQTERHPITGERDYDAIAKGQGQYLVKALLTDLKRRLKKH